MLARADLALDLALALALEWLERCSALESDPELELAEGPTSKKLSE